MQEYYIECFCSYSYFTKANNQMVYWKDIRIQALPVTEHISIKYEQNSPAVVGLDPSPSSSDLIWQLWGKQSDFPAT